MDQSQHALLSGFIQQAEENPLRPALVSGDHVWTYGDMFSEASALASKLEASRDHTHQQRVGIFAHNGKIEHVARIAAWLAGAAFVPLNPKFPDGRIADIINQAECDVIIADRHGVQNLPAVLKDVHKPPDLILPEADGADLSQVGNFQITLAKELDVSQPVKDYGRTFAPDDIAYIMFTSGSTGSPKGVPISVSNLRSYLNYAGTLYSLNHNDTYTAPFEGTFDLSLATFLAWNQGARVALMAPQDIENPVGFINKHQVTMWYSVPSVIKPLVRDGMLESQSLLSLRYSLFCGEALPVTIAKAWQTAAPYSAIHNHYGPTEATLSVTYSTWLGQDPSDPSDNGIVSIGRVYPGHTTLIANEDGERVEEGQRGELCIAGPQVFSGYLNRPDITATRFFKRTGSDGLSMRYYRTGDIVIDRGNDGMSYIGRNDQQVKVNGYRIELGDIEATLRKVGAADAVALAYPAEDPKMIIAAITGGSLDGSQLRERVASYLPAYMVPREIHSILEMPLNTNGKIDRREVRQLLEASLSSSHHEASHLTSVISIDEILQLVEGALHLEQGTLNRETNRLSGQNPKWDSLGQINIILALEKRMGKTISDEEARSLCSIQSIFEFANRRSDVKPASQAASPISTTAHEIHRSLRGVHVAETETTHADGFQGELRYCGYDVRELVEVITFEELALLLLNRELPDEAQRREFSDRLVPLRSIPDRIVARIQEGVAIGAHPTDIVADSLSGLSLVPKKSGGLRANQSLEEARDEAIHLMAQTPTIIAAHHRLREGRDPIPPDSRLGHAENFLHMLGLPQTTENIKALNAAHVLHADNGATAATFAALVATGAWCSAHETLMTAINTFKGLRHGGVIEDAYGQLMELDGVSAVRDYVRRSYEAGSIPRGLGHAVYGSNGDPRTYELRELAYDAARRAGRLEMYDKINALIAASHEMTDRKMVANNDLFGALLYTAMGLSHDQSVSMYISQRMLGWFAHMLEQKSLEQPLVRPEFHYAGSPPRALSGDYAIRQNGIGITPISVDGTKIDIRVVPFGSNLYQETLPFRERWLREPIGQTFGPTDLQDEESSIHIVATKAKDDGGLSVVGTIMLVPKPDGGAEIRQLAVDPSLHHADIAMNLETVLEQIARKRGHSHLRAKARTGAVGLYTRLGFTRIGDEFISERTGQPNVLMAKELDSHRL